MKVCDNNVSRCFLMGVSVAGIIVTIAFLIEKLGAFQ